MRSVTWSARLDSPVCAWAAFALIVSLVLDSLLLMARVLESFCAATAFSWRGERGGEGEGVGREQGVDGREFLLGDVAGAAGLGEGVGDLPHDVLAFGAQFGVEVAAYPVVLVADLGGYGVDVPGGEFPGFVEVFEALFDELPVGGVAAFDFGAEVVQGGGEPGMMSTDLSHSRARSWSTTSKRALSSSRNAARSLSWRSRSALISRRNTSVARSMAASVSLDGSGRGISSVYAGPAGASLSAMAAPPGQRSTVSLSSPPGSRGRHRW